MEGEKIPAGEEVEKFLYTYPLVCKYCGRVFKIVKTNDIEIAGKPSDGICEGCSEKEQMKITVDPGIKNRTEASLARKQEEERRKQEEFLKEFS